MMAPDRLNRPAHILLLDNAWPYEVSSNSLRLSILRQLVNEIEPSDGPLSAGPSILFDLIVVRDSPFFRHATDAYYRFGRDGEQWLDFIARDGLPHLDHIRDERFLGYAPPSESFKYDLPLIAHGSAKIISHNPSTRKVKRSYHVEEDETLLPKMEPELQNSYAVAFGRSKRGHIFDGETSHGFFPLILLAKQESLRLYPHNPMVIVEVNPLFGLSNGEHDQFIDWYREERGNELFSAYQNSPKPIIDDGTVRFRSGNELENEARSSVLEFEAALQEIKEKRPGYNQHDLEGIDYHGLKLLPKSYVRDIETGAKHTTFSRNSNNLWMSIRGCALSLKTVAPPPPYTIEDSKMPKPPLKLLSFGRCNVTPSCYAVDRPL